MHKYLAVLFFFLYKKQSHKNAEMWAAYLSLSANERSHLQGIFFIIEFCSFLHYKGIISPIQTVSHGKFPLIVEW